MNNYFIDNYTPRLNNSFHDDTQPCMNNDVWQKEIYTFARQIANREGLHTVTDIGCGSAFKLLANFADFDTYGIDLPLTVEWLKKTYPTRNWLVSDFSVELPVPGLVIASDVIEHLPDPDEMLWFIARTNANKIIISTPDRDILQIVQKGWTPNGTRNGPPWNAAHVREWSFVEFERYISSWFMVEKHFISNAAQATQCIVCRKK